MLRTLLNKLLFLSLLIYQSVAEEIACQGKIDFKNAEIEMKNIKVQSIMKSGSKGYQIILLDDASYQIPIDSSKHTIFLRPLAVGFLFQPKEYKLTPQQLKQHCNSETKKKSFDFTLIGFQIQSKVITKKSSHPLKNITISITPQNSTHQLISVTDDNGIFSFDKIMPETYIMKIAHKYYSEIKWERQEVKCQASVSKALRVYEECSEVKFVATGFNVRGSVFVKGLVSLNNVEVKLSPKNKSKQKEYCSRNQCTVLTNDNGIYEFIGVEQGDFNIQVIKTKQMAQFSPKSIPITMKYSPIKLEEPIHLIKVANYEVVITSDIDVKKTTIQLLNTVTQQTVLLKFDKNTKKIKFPDLDVNTQYNLIVKSPHYKFFETKIIITHPEDSKDKVLQIKANSIEVCGIIQMKKSGSSKRDIKIYKESDGQEQYKRITTNEKGRFCEYLPSNKYRITTELTEQDRQNGNVYHPNDIIIDLNQKPILDLKFEQTSIKVIGVIEGFQDLAKDMPNVEVSLIFLDKKQEPAIIKSVVIPKIKNNGDQLKINFEFENVGAGSYSVRVNSSIYCFEKDELDVVVTGERSDVELSLPFMKKGYNFNYRATHAIQQADIVQKKEQKILFKGIMLGKGKNSLCVPNEGQYYINIPKCYSMKKKENSISFSVPIQTLGSNVNQVLIQPDQFGVSGSVYIKDFSIQSAATAKKNEPEFFLKNIEKIIGVKVTRGSEIIQLTKDQNSSQAKYNFTFFAEPGRKIDIKLSKFANISKDEQNFYKHLLIKPENIPITMSENCKVYQDFFVNLGVIIRGETKPKLQGVAITMTDKFTQQVLQTIQTNAEGKYQFAPIDPSTQFTLNAERDGYVLEQMVKNQSSHDFIMKKLSQLFLTVIDGDSKKPISGVKLLLSSSTMNRQKQQHTSDIEEVEPGLYKFNKIKSGKNQRLQVMLRQYEFDNGGVIELEIIDGETKRSQIYGHRVTFSAYGSVILGDLRKVKNVLVRAKCLNKAICQQFVHESVTNKEGQFRIEELKPKASYELRVVIVNQQGKENQIDENEYQEKIETRIQKCTPEKKIIEMKRFDITDIEFVVKMESSLVDIQGEVMFQDELSEKTMSDILKEPEINLTLHEIFEDKREPQLITEQTLPKTRVFVINKLKRASKYEITLTSNTGRYLEKKYQFSGKQSGKFLTLTMNLSKKGQNTGFKSQSGSPAFGVLLLAVLIGGFIYYKRSA